MSTANTTLSTRVNEKDKIEDAKILDSLGLNLSAAVNMMLKQIIIQKGLPFAVTTQQNKAGLTDKLYGSISGEMTLDEIRDERTKKYEVVD